MKFQIAVYDATGSRRPLATEGATTYREAVRLTEELLRPRMGRKDALVWGHSAMVDRAPDLCHISTPTADTDIFARIVDTRQADGIPLLHDDDIQ